MDANRRLVLIVAALLPAVAFAAIAGWQLRGVDQPLPGTWGGAANQICENATEELGRFAASTDTVEVFGPVAVDVGRRAVRDLRGLEGGNATTEAFVDELEANVDAAASLVEALFEQDVGYEALLVEEWPGTGATLSSLAREAGAEECVRLSLGP